MNEQKQRSTSDLHPLTRRSLLQAAGAGVGAALLGAETAAETSMTETDSDDDARQYRPAYHFAPSSGWMNDPNGMVYHDGVYHLFYQAGADRRRWDHATSEDLLTWDEHGTKIPDDGVQAYSGGAVVDELGAAGFDRGAIVATYTGHRDDGIQDQRVASSADGGRTLERYAENPVIQSAVGNFRDPNPLRYEPTGNWRLVVARVESAPDRPAGIEIYESDDLLEWTYLDTYESGDECWECPSLYEVPVEGTDRSRWVMTVSVEWNHVEHHVGRFDGTTFSVDERVRADHGFDFYGAQAWSNAPGRPGLQLAWMSNWEYAKDLPNPGWQGAQSIPRTVSLVDTDDGLELRQRPASEVESIRRRELAAVGSEPISTETDPLANIALAGRTLDVEATIHPGSADRVELAVRESDAERTVIAYDVPNQELIVDRGESGAFFEPGHYDVETGPLPRLDDGTIELRVLVDRCSVEVFANDGRYANTNLVFPDPASTGVSLTASGGTAELIDLVGYELATGE